MFGFGGNYLWAIIILILIVLQWFRVGYGGGVGGVGGGVPGVVEPGLMSNGGLFIIAIFILIACACFRGGLGGGMMGGYGGLGGYGMGRGIGYY